jgi:hypothetical protein
MFNFMSLVSEKGKERHKSVLKDFYEKFIKGEVTAKDAFDKLKNSDIDPDNYDDKKKYWKIFEFTNENLSSLSNEDRDYWEDEDNQNKIYAKCSEAAIDILEGREPEEISDEEE